MLHNSFKFLFLLGLMSAFSAYSMENIDTNQDIIANSPVTINQSHYQGNNEYISRLTELLENLDQWLFVYSPEKKKYILNLSLLENLIYDAESGREIKSIQDYGVQEKGQIDQYKEEKEQLSYTIPTEDFSNFSEKYSRNIFLENSVRHIMANDFEDENNCNWYIHNAFEKFPLNAAQNVTHLALQTKDLMEKRRALSIIATHKNLLQKQIDAYPDEVKKVAHDEKFVKILLDSGVKFNQEQISNILKENNLASICCILSQIPFSLKEKPISTWFYYNPSHPESFDFNSVTKCEGLTDYTKDMVINSLPENQYKYAKGVFGYLLEASITGETKSLETYVSQNKPSPEIFALKEGDEISKKIAEKDKEIFNLINQICLGNNFSYSEGFIKKVNNFVEKYSEILHKTPNFLNCLLTKIQDNNNKKNQKISDEVNSQPAFCWPSVGIGPSVYSLYRSSCEGNFNPWAALLGAGVLAWSGWKTYTYYDNYQRLTRAINLQKETNKLEGYLTILEDKEKTIKEIQEDEEGYKVDVVERQWPKVAPKILGPLALGCFAPVIPAILKIAFKKDTQVEVVNNKPTFGLLSKINGLGFSATSAWLWRQNKNKFGSEDAQKLFMSCQKRGRFNGFEKIQEFKNQSNMRNDTSPKLIYNTNN